MRLRPATKGWIGLAIYVAAWDLLAEETLSHGWEEALKHPLKRWQLVVAWGYITLHLFCLVPRKYDPLRSLARRVHD